VDRFCIIFFGAVIVPVFFWHRRGYIIFSHNRHSLQGDTNTNDFIFEMTPENLRLPIASDIVPITYYYTTPQLRFEATEREFL